MQALDRPVLRHVLNSPVLPGFRKQPMTWSGLESVCMAMIPEELQRKLLPVSSWFTTVAQVGESGSREHRVWQTIPGKKEPMVLAVLNIGYADGFRRSLGNGVGRVWLHGDYAPVVGRVCMDM